MIILLLYSDLPMSIHKVQSLVLEQTLVLHKSLSPVFRPPNEYP